MGLRRIDLYHLVAIGISVDRNVRSTSNGMGVVNANKSDFNAGDFGLRVCWIILDESQGQETIENRGRDILGNGLVWFPASVLNQIDVGNFFTFNEDIEDALPSLVKTEERKGMS
jgi:hypothetical protein